MYPSGAQSRTSGGARCAIVHTATADSADAAITNMRRPALSGGSHDARARYRKYASARISNERTGNDTSSFTITRRMSESIRVRPVNGRGELRRFVDYMNERNAGDPHWVP